MTSTQFYQIFSLIILLRCASDFVSLLVNAYWIAIDELENDFLDNMVYVFLWMWSLLLIHKFLIMVGTICSTCSMSKLAVENIYDIQTRIGRKNLPYKSMELFLLKSKLNELKFSVCGFFPLDWTLIYSMVAGITTYLVYLIQFREMEQSRSSSQ
ncbi:gustatory receptor 68a-like isoform X2 [Coccinella septempunctata]|uniref:gustatory receptor 68a-like isoform X2 n=1 Tax=Coccinella septempunctata TaxID=41139 RepID=UPI001D068909|nr:gustatory receptor 68a-like isoform X2 [Coccinella septempunctata]